MSEQEMPERPESASLVLEYLLDAPPEKVWRAISIAELREQWLPLGDLAQAESVSSVPGREICYRLRDDEPPFLVSVVTLQIRPGAAGGTALRIVQDLADARVAVALPPAANDGCFALLRAA